MIRNPGWLMAVVAAAVLPSSAFAASAVPASAAPRDTSRAVPVLPDGVAAADTSADGTITFHYREDDSLNLSPQEKIRELNARILKNPTDGDLYNNLGVVYAQQEEWALARDAFLSAVQAKPMEADFHRNLGLVFMRLDDPDLAVREFEAYRRFSPTGGADAWRLSAEAQRRAGDTEAARKTYRKGIEAVDRHDRAEQMRLMLGLAGLVHEEGPESAERELLEEFHPAATEFLERARRDGDEEGVQQARALVDNLIALYVQDAEVMHQSGLPLEAAGRYRQAYDLAPSRTELLPPMVSAYLDAGEELKARVAARLARDAHPDAVGTWIATARVHERERRTDEAIEAYLKAREIDPAYRGLDVAIGQLYLRKGNVAEARRYLAGSIGAEGTPPEVLYNYAVSLMRDDKHTAAITPLRRVTRERPDWFPGWSALASALRLSGQHAQAVDAYRRALELGPDAKLAFAMGVSAKRAADVATAIEAYQQALALDPQYAEACYNLALAFMDAGRHEEAIASFDRLMELEGESYRALFSQGRACFHLGRYDDALARYEKALEHQETANAYNAMGLVFDKLGDKKAAKEYYELAKTVGAGG
ncbi:MAG: tetratricopeptide repeat protein [Candidatus Krumholzibacteriia bacterium]